MSYAIGSRIKELRTKNRISQEEMAELLGTTRQRYSRLENGQIDISYLTIKKIADHLGVLTKEVTDAAHEQKGLVAYFRERDTCSDVIDSVAKIEEILRVFHAHEKLYHQAREKDHHVDR